MEPSRFNQDAGAASPARAESTTATTAAENAGADVPVNTSPPATAVAPNNESINVAWCDAIRNGKAFLAAAIVAGRELATARDELREKFDEFINTKTPFTVPEAHTLIAFEIQAGLTVECLSPAVAVPLSRVLQAVALLGRFFVEQQDQNDVTHGQ